MWTIFIDICCIRNLNIYLFKIAINSLSYWASLVTQMVKNLPAMQETLVQSLSWEDPLEKGILIHNILKLKIAIFSKTKKN